MSSSLAERLKMISAPANARLLLGGIGAQTSSQISTPNFIPSPVTLHAVACHKELGLGTDVNRSSCIEDICRIQILSRGKPTLLVELTIVGEVCLGDNPHDATTLNDYCAII